MTPIISNSDKTRFLFGTFADAGRAPVFHGAVIYGSGLTYDPETRLPIGGTIERIEVQTRNTGTVLMTHATYPDIHSTVADLNADFADALMPWYDASDFFALSNLDDNAPLDLNVELDSNQMEDLVSGKKALHLKTGEVLSAHELSGIFAATTGKVTPKKRRRAKRKFRKTDPTVRLDTTYENAANSNFNDLDIEALENDLRVGAL